jgi:hypothetical protein
MRLSQLGCMQFVNGNVLMYVITIDNVLHSLWPFPMLHLCLLHSYSTIHKTHQFQISLNTMFIFNILDILQITQHCIQNEMF